MNRTAFDDPKTRSLPTMVHATASAIVTPTPAVIVAVFVATVFVSLVGALAVLLFGHLGVSTAALLAGAVVAIPAAVLAATRFEWFVLGLFVIRPSLDGLHSGGGALSGAIDPATAVGAMFVVTAGVWLSLQHQEGTWVRTSTVTRALYVLVVACALSIPGSAHPITALLATVKVLAGVLMFAVLEQIFARDRRRGRLVVIAILFSAVVPILVGLFQTISGGGIIKDSTGLRSVQGTFVHPNDFGTYLVIVLVLGIAMLGNVDARWRPAMIGLIGCSVLLMLHTYSRIAWGAAIVGLVYLGIRLHKAILIGMFVGALAVLVVAPSVVTRFSDLGAKSVAPGIPSNSALWRFAYWSQLIPLAGRDPVNGLGLENVSHSPDLLPQQVGIVGTAGVDLQPHNIFVQAYVETGLLGLGALIWVIVAMGSALSRRARAVRGSPDKGIERILAFAGIAIGLTLLAQSFSENMFTETSLYWYLAGAATFGMRCYGDPPAERAQAHAVAEAP